MESKTFEAVAAELSGSLLRYLQRLVGDAHLAEDLLQESLLRISKALPECFYRDRDQVLRCDRKPPREG